MASLDSGTGDSILIHSTGLPTVGDANSAMNAAAASSKEVSLLTGS